nr:dynactin-associated protein-like [Loxodonta africana]
MVQACDIGFSRMDRKHGKYVVNIEHSGNQPVRQSFIGDWSLWKIFLASLLACVITTAIGVLIVCLVYNGRNFNPSIIIQLPESIDLLHMIRHKHSRGQVTMKLPVQHVSKACTDVTAVCVDPGTFEDSNFPERQCRHAREWVTQTISSDCSLWEIFLICLLACVITTAIGVLTVCLVNKGGNGITLIIIWGDDGKPIKIIPGTTSSPTSQPIVTDMIPQLTMTTTSIPTTTKSVPTTTTADISTTSVESIILKSTPTTSPEPKTDIISTKCTIDTSTLNEVTTTMEMSTVFQLNLPPQ